MKPLHLWPAAERAAITGVFTDIDDTLTTDGHITPDALEALHVLKAAGYAVVAVTGRPVGWSEPFVLAWPVDAIVAENGAVALVPGDEPGTLRKLYQRDEALRRANARRLREVAQRIVATGPGAKLSRDSAGRETDIAIDHSEFVQLPAACVAQVVQLMQAEGMNATVSSIHINGWYGDHNKLSGARWILRELWGRELDDELAQWLFVGDSTNDALMFGHFPNSVGVANVRRFESELVALPRYVTPGERGAGFAQAVQAVISSKKGR